jgi:hypothetical protein
MAPGDVWVLVGEPGGRALGVSAFRVPITWPMPTWKGARLTPTTSRKSATGGKLQHHHTSYIKCRSVSGLTDREKAPTRCPGRAELDHNQGR